MIIVTGALGFIGSCLVEKLNQQGHLKNLIVVDDFYKDWKEVNLKGKFIRDWIHRDLFLDFFQKRASQIEFVFHLGARTDTTSTDEDLFHRLNLQYSQAVWNICAAHGIPLVYASSAATYGDGSLGYKDDHQWVAKLKPLNAYGRSKNDFDHWALQQPTAPPFWAGLKFFNVYGPNEYHKKRMASVIFHAYHQIRQTGGMKLFRSHKEGIADGHQSRDFIYVKDVINVCYWLYENRPESGLYNVGTGQARTFLDLVNATFKAMDLSANIEFIDTPEDIRDTYQYFTQADQKKILQAGYSSASTSLEDGIRDYVHNYLKTGVYF